MQKGRTVEHIHSTQVHLSPDECIVAGVIWSPAKLSGCVSLNLRSSTLNIFCDYPVYVHFKSPVLVKLYQKLILYLVSCKRAEWWNLLRRTSTAAENSLIFLISKHLNNICMQSPSRWKSTWLKYLTALTNNVLGNITVLWHEAKKNYPPMHTNVLLSVQKFSYFVLPMSTCQLRCQFFVNELRYGGWSESLETCQLESKLLLLAETFMVSLSLLRIQQSRQ